MFVNDFSKLYYTGECTGVLLSNRDKCYGEYFYIELYNFKKIF